MISFKSFVDAIHEAIMMANEALMDKNTGLLDKYFNTATNEDELQSSLDGALKASKDIADKKGSVTREDFKNASDAIEKARQALSADDNQNSAQIPGTLSPKSVVVEFPQQTPNGIEFVEVHVPLITLVPVAMSQIEKATISANFDIEIVNDEVQLNFTNKSSGLSGRKSKATRGKLELTIAPQESSEGLRQLIEGYEKALKAQIPH